MKLDLKYYLRVFMRRSPYFILITALFSSIGLSVAMLLPAEYEARATLLVEAEQIPANLAASTVQVQAAEQLQIIEQRLMTRANLLEMANRARPISGRQRGQRADGDIHCDRHAGPHHFPRCDNRSWHLAPERPRHDPADHHLPR